MIKIIEEEIGKVLVVGDLHFCEFSSILRKKDLRLTGLVNTLKWIISLAIEQGCKCIIFLGDFFDKPELNAEELTALSNIKWPNELKYYCLVGNHELDGDCNSTNILRQINNFIVIDEPTIVKNNSCNYLFLPYIVNDKERKLDLYLKDFLNEDKSLAIFSHNDIKGLQMGQFISKEGFDIEDIKSHCTLFLNGHIHNEGLIEQKIINIGNITGQNFSEDATKYSHKVVVLDYIYNEKDTKGFFEAKSFVNPYAFNFYKIDLTSNNNWWEGIPYLKQNAILSVRCFQKDISYIKKYLLDDDNIKEFRIISIPEVEEGSEANIESLLEIDHIEKFKEYILEQLGPSKYLIEELQEISL